MEVKLCSDERRAPRVRAGVLWYRASHRDEAVLANRYFAQPPIVRSLPYGDLDFLCRCDGTRSLAHIAAAMQAPLRRVLGTLGYWETLAPGMFQWSDCTAADRRFQNRLRAADLLHRQFRAAMTPIADNASYHRHCISDALCQFDRLETTVSHSFREPHPALRGLRYGEAFCDSLLKRGALRPRSRILEIGGGLGYFAAAFMARLRQRAPDVYGTATYTLLDLSPALQDSQRRLCRPHGDRVAFMHGDVERLRLTPASVDVVLANEMIADLSIGSADPNNLLSRRPQTEAESLVQRFGLAWNHSLPRLAVNVGAIHLVEHLASWLAPGGTAVITEYGSLENAPALVALEGHNEYSIHFGHLMQVACALRLTAQTENLGEFLEADGDYEVVRRTSLQMLRYHLLPHIGAGVLPARTYYAAALQRQLDGLWPHIGNLQTARLRTDGWMTPFRFCALTLRAACPDVSPSRQLLGGGSHP